MIKLPVMDPGVVSKEIQDFIISRTESKAGGVIGLSGGVDSTVVAALASTAYRHMDKKLLGLIMPSSINDRRDADDAWHAAMRLDIEAYEINISPFVQNHRRMLPWELYKRSLGNMMSRIRANILHTAAEAESLTVLGTGNHDEDVVLGYYTLFGDGAVHCSPIGALSKRLVREMAVYLGFEDIAARIPTAGLEEGQSDFKDLGYSYEFAELIFEGLTSGIFEIDLPREEQIITVGEKDMEDYYKLFNKDKFTSIPGMVEDVLHRIYTVAKPKARLLKPETAEVTLNYEGRTCYV